MNRRTFLKQILVGGAALLSAQHNEAHAKPLIPPFRPAPLRPGTDRGLPATDLARRWVIDDLAPANNEGGRWTWGGEVLHHGFEAYADAANGQRAVWYLPKGRLEVRNTDANRTDPSYVSSGNLVRELVGGTIATGDSATQRYAPAVLPIVGDVVPAAQTVTYFDLHRHASLDGTRRSAPRVGEPITERIDPQAQITTDERFAQYSIVVGRYDDAAGHNIAAIWDEALGAEQIAALAGAPLAEPLWVSVPVDGTPTDVLIQLWERRVLAYTPSSAPGTQVQWGDVGRHYAQWRYGAVSTPPLDPRAVLDATEMLPLAGRAPAAIEPVQDRSGTVGVAVFDLRSGTLYEWGNTDRFKMYSTAKVPIMLAVLNKAKNEGRGVTSTENALIKVMIQQSDNVAADRLFRLAGGPPAITAWLRSLGLDNIGFDGYPWGLGRTTPQDMARLLGKLANGTILNRELRAYALDTMRGVIGEQRWGVGEGAPADGTVALKNGWYPSPDGWTINTTGMVDTSRALYVVSAYTSKNRSMESGVRAVSEVARRVHAALS